MLADVIVSKFGGSSLSDAGRVEKVVRIIQADPRRQFIVVSAPGKRYKEDEKITDILIDCYRFAQAGRDFHNRFSLIRDRFVQMATELGIGRQIIPLIDEVESHIDVHSSFDDVVSRGEYLNAHLIAHYTGFAFVDAASLIRFSDDGEIDRESTDRLIQNTVGESPCIIPGFYGSKADGRIQIFSRGGSDISAALISGALKAEIYENWTDVSGILSIDPTIVENPQPIKEITYRQLREMSYLGATVFHEQAVCPAADKGVPVNIRNTHDPDHPGTMISVKTQNDQAVIGIAGRKGFCDIYVEKPMLNTDKGFMPRLMEILNEHGIRVFHSSSGCDSIQFIVHNKDDLDWDRISSALKESFKDYRIVAGVKLAIIGVVGSYISVNMKVISAVFDGLANKDIPIYSFRSDYSPYSFMLAVPQQYYSDAMVALYHSCMPSSRQ